MLVTMHKLSLFKGAALLLVTAALGGCAKIIELTTDDNPIAIFPSSERQDVPVNAMISVTFEHEAGMDQASVQKLLSRPNKFLITEDCQPQASTDMAPAPTSENTDTAAKKEDKTKAAPERTSGRQINYYLHALEVTQEGASKATGNDASTPKDNSAVDGKSDSDYVIAFLVPQTTDGQTAPLKESTNYCLTLKPFKNKAGKLIAGRDVSFKTEDVTGFMFDTIAEAASEITFNRSNTSLEKLREDKPEANNRDFFMASFGDDHAINPETFLKQTRLCLKKAEVTGEAQDRIEKTRCKPVPHRIHLYEDLNPSDTDTAYNTVGYNLFAVIPPSIARDQIYVFTIHDTVKPGEEEKANEKNDEHLKKQAETYGPVLKSLTLEVVATSAEDSPDKKTLGLYGNINLHTRDITHTHKGFAIGSNQ